MRVIQRNQHKILCLVVLIFLAACNGMRGTNARITEVLTQQMSKGLQKDKLQQVESIVLIKVDKLTEKEALLKRLDEAKENLESENNGYEVNKEFFASDSMAIEGKRKNKDAIDLTLAKRYRTDSGYLQRNIGRIALFSKQKDSLAKLITGANNNKFAMFYVTSKVYYSQMNSKDSATFSTFMTPDYNTTDTLGLVNFLLNAEVPKDL